MTQLDMGKDLRDAALEQSKQGREERIEAVRGELILWSLERGRTELTADHVMDAVQKLGMDEGDTRWTGNVLKGWPFVEPTDRFVPSRRKVRHAAPVRVWRWV